MSRTVESKNKAIVFETFDTLFNGRDHAAAEKFWSANYIQHIAPGRPFQLGHDSPPALKYEAGLVVAEGDYVIAYGRFSGHTGSPMWLGLRRTCSHEGWVAGRALGCAPRRGNARDLKKPDFPSLVTNSSSDQGEFSRDNAKRA
jgi:hypothetical protein